MGWVVRAGEAKAADLINGYAPHRAVPGLYGFSVQYQLGTTVEELAQAGPFPNAQASYQDEIVLSQALQARGYSLRLVRSPGKGHHHTFAVMYDASNAMQQSLRPRSPRPSKRLFCACPILTESRAAHGGSHEAHFGGFQHFEQRAS